MYKTKYYLKHSIIFLWIAVICAVGFMVAWLKTYAPNITILYELEIEKTIFNFLVNFEWIFAMIVFIILKIKKNTIYSIQNLMFYITVILMLIQTFWIMPYLNIRADLYALNKPILKSYLYYYIIIDVVKVFCLLTIGLKTIINPHTNNYNY